MQEFWCQSVYEGYAASLFHAHEHINYLFHNTKMACAHGNRITFGPRACTLSLQLPGRWRVHFFRFHLPSLLTSTTKERLYIFKFLLLYTGSSIQSGRNTDRYNTQRVINALLSNYVYICVKCLCIRTCLRFRAMTIRHRAQRPVSRNLIFIFMNNKDGQRHTQARTHIYREVIVCRFNEQNRIRISLK